MSWEKYTFKDFLKRSKIPILIENDKEYKRVTIKIKHNGVSLRDTVKGVKIGTKKQFILKAGQFILSKIDARYGAFGIAPQEVDNAIITGNFWAYDVNFNIVNIDWFNQFINSQDFYNFCGRASSGITHRKYLNEEAFLNSIIYLPEIEEQQKIIDEFKKNEKLLTNLSTELTHQLDIVKKLRQAFLREAMQGKLTEDWRKQKPSVEPATELLAKIKAEKEQLIKEKKIKKQKPLPPITKEEIPFEIPENWEWTRLGEIIYNTEGGKSPSCKNVPASMNEWGVIKTTAVQEMMFVQNENKVLPTSFIVQSNHIVYEDDVLITRAGPKNRVGIVCCVENLTQKLILSDKTIRIQFNKTMLISKYIAFALNSPLIKPIIEEKMTGMADSQVNISQDNMKTFPFTLPPLSEQKAIVAKLDELMAYCDSLEESIKNSQSQNAMLLQQVLREALEPKLEKETIV